MSDTSWGKYGKEDPYFGVLTDPQYRTANLDSKAIDDFFSTGEKHVNTVLENLKKYFELTDVTGFKNVLDFGCGVGRLVVPLAKKFSHVTGVDISEHMLSEAQKNVDANNLKNVSLIQSSDISKVDFPTPFDFVHTYIVLQHIPLKYGYNIIEKLISCVKPGGYGMLHFTYDNDEAFLRQQVAILKGQNKLARFFFNLLNGRKLDSPSMLMGRYDFKKVFALVRKYEVQHVALDFESHNGYHGVCMYFKK